MKQLITIALLALLVCGLSACGGNADNQGSGEEQGQEATGMLSEGQAQQVQDAVPEGQQEQQPPAEETPAQEQPLDPAPAYAADFSDTLILGDSVLHLMEGALYEYMPAATINAVSGRTMELGGANEDYSDEFGILDIIRADGGNGYARYVIGAASNEVDGMSYEMGAEIINILHGKPVWFITQMVTNNSNSTANTNAAIDALCADYPNAHKVDWYQLCMDHPEFIVDNAHATTEGAYALSAAIVEALGQ